VKLGALLLGAMVAAVWTPSPAAACRCAQRPLEAYFESAEIVLIGTVLAVSPGVTDQGVGFVAVEVEPAFAAGRPFKGDLSGVTLVTSDSSASCGVDVRVGESYLLFASPHAPGESRAWFDTCSGSRLYAGGPRVSETSPFVGLAPERIVPRLFELAGLAEPPPPDPPGTSFHTSPACWPEPRVFHDGPPADDARDRVRLSWRRAPPPTADAGIGAEVSPNGAYRLWTRNPDTTRDGPWSAAVLVDVEREELLWIELREVAGPVAPRWINEKLIFLRVPWGASAWTDLVIDVEAGVRSIEEAARYGREAFEQFREACAGQCPCLAVPGSVVTSAEPPRSRPAAGEPTSDPTALVSALVYLDRDWDGRIFTEPAGRTSVRSALESAGAAGTRDEYPADVLEVRQTATGPWLLVDLYAVSRCSDPRAAPVHRGWVPAYSSAGRLVAGTYPGGC
jgi:hypothetical protein